MRIAGTRSLKSGVVALAVLTGLAVWGQCKPASAQTKPSDRMLVTVNGESIRESDLMAGMPDDAFASALEDLKKLKLKRLIEETIRSQFLNERKITVDKEAFAGGMKEFEVMIRTPGCPCCGGGYRDLDQFMKINAFTLPEVRRRVTCDVGLKLYMEKMIKEAAAPKALAEAIKKRRAQIEAEYFEAYTISFEYMRDPEYFRDEKTVREKKEKLADQALQRLKKGEAFEKVAREMSEDEASAPKGGALGCVHCDILGREVEEVFRKLPPGTYSDVLKPKWGCCIVMRKKLTEEEIASVVIEQTSNYVDEQVSKDLNAARDHAKIQYLDDSLKPHDDPGSNPGSANGQ